jgi:2-aminoadipate transaminase
VRRIGEVIGEQLELFGALTGARPAPTAPEREAAPLADPELADVLHLPRQQAGEARRTADRRTR